MTPPKATDDTTPIADDVKPPILDPDWREKIEIAKNVRRDVRKAREGKDVGIYSSNRPGAPSAAE